MPEELISYPLFVDLRDGPKLVKPGHENTRPRGRPRKYANPAEKKRAYRQRQRQVKHHHRTRYTGQEEWYTPAWCLDAARQVLGTIDLDPASSDAAQATVKAEHYYTAQENAFIHAWKGTVWLNPPYKQPLIEHFVSRLVDEYTAGHVSQAILLTPNNTETAWYQLADAAATLVSTPKGRIAFMDPSSQRLHPMQGQVFFYFGAQGEHFRQVFSTFGGVR